MYFLLLLLALCTLLVYYFRSTSYNYWKSKGVPFDKPFLLFGSFYEVATRKGHVFYTMRSIYQKFNTPYVGFYIFNKPNLMVRSPDLIKRILVKDFSKFQDRNVIADEEGDPIAYHSLLTARGAVWKAMRAKISPAFTSGKIRMMLPLIKECAQDLVDYLARNQGHTMDVRFISKKYTVDIIASCAFGFKANCLKENNTEMEEMANRLTDFDGWRRTLTSLIFFFFPTLFKALKLTIMDKTAGDYLFAIFKDSLRKREEMKIERHDLIDLLNNIRKNETVTEEYKFDDLKMLSQAVVFFNAGSDTTSTTMSFMLYELATHKDIQDRLRQEVTEAFSKDGQFTYEQILSMKYLDMVLSETLRKYPIAPFLSRQATFDYTIEETGVKIDQNTNVFVSVAGLHYDPQYYPEPERFNPERFSDQNRSNIAPYTYLPFGDGPRSCIGMRFALLVAKITLASIIKDFRLEVDRTTPVPLQFKIGALGLDPTTVPLQIHQI